MSFVRRLRGAATLGALWGLGWLPAGIALGVVMGWMRPPFTHDWDAMFLGFWTGIGVVSGGVFAALLATLERNRTLEELSDRRVALWGALGGATVPVLLTVFVLSLPNVYLSAEAPPVFVGMAALGGACGRASLWLARRGSRPADPHAPTA